MPVGLMGDGPSMRRTDRGLVESSSAAVIWSVSSARSIAKRLRSVVTATARRADAAAFGSVFMAAGATDMRLGMDGLSAVTRSRIGLDPLSGRLILSGIGPVV